MSNNRNDRKPIRRAQAEERAEARAKRTNQEQLDLLESRGVTEGREVNRLLVKIMKGEA